MSTPKRHEMMRSIDLDGLDRRFQFIGDYLGMAQAVLTILAAWG